MRGPSRGEIAAARAVVAAAAARLAEAIDKLGELAPHSPALVEAKREHERLAGTLARLAQIERDAAA
jgi:hypothetical protein